MNVLLSVVAAVFVVADDPFKTIGFEEALKEARKTERVVMIDFFTTWCVPCKKLDKVTWADNKVRAWLSENTLALKIDAEKNVSLARRYNVDGYPSLVFINPDGSPRGRIVGYRNPADFIKEAQDVLEGIRRSHRLRRQLEEQGWTDPMLRQDLGDELMREGLYSEALEEYLWCFDEGLKHEDSYVGVRLSFLLSSIVRLGVKHPPALEALRERRAAAKAALLGGKGNYQIATDFASINQYLNEAELTLEVFEQLAKVEIAPASDQAQAREALFVEATDLLLNLRRYDVVLEHVGDVTQRVQAQIQSHLEIVKLMGPSEYDAEERQYLVEEASKYYEAVVGTGRKEEGETIVNMLLEFDDSVLTYKALVRRATRAEADDAVACDRRSSWKVVLVGGCDRCAHQG